MRFAVRHVPLPALMLFSAAIAAATPPSPRAGTSLAPVLVAGSGLTPALAAKLDPRLWDEMAAVVPAFKGVSYRRIDKVGLQTPVPDDQHPGTPFLFADRFPSGRERVAV